MVWEIRREGGSAGGKGKEIEEIRKRVGNEEGRWKGCWEEGEIRGEGEDEGRRGNVGGKMGATRKQ
mgnify:CR=1 FL=1